MLQATRQLTQLEKLPIIEPDPIQIETDFRQQVESWLTKRRDEAERAGLVSRDPNNDMVIRELLKNILGEPNNGIHLHILARDTGKIVVPEPSQTPPHRGPLPDEEPDNENDPETANSTTTPSTSDSPQLQSPPTVPIQNPKSKIARRKTLLFPMISPAA